MTFCQRRTVYTYVESRRALRAIEITTGKDRVGACRLAADATGTTVGPPRPIAENGPTNPATRTHAPTVAWARFPPPHRARIGTRSLLMRTPIRRPGRSTR